jgi:hypothetical protein
VVEIIIRWIVARIRATGEDPARERVALRVHSHAGKEMPY